MMKIKKNKDLGCKIRYLQDNKGDEVCYLLNRLLIQNALNIKIEQETQKVKTWEELEAFYGSALLLQ